MATNVLILCAGAAHTERVSGYPFFLTEVAGVTLLEKIVNNASSISNSKFFFTFLASDINRYHLDRVARHLAADASIVRVPASTGGAACTALLAACQISHDDSLLIISANELVDMDYGVLVHDFESRGLDAGTVTFRSLHPRYSYVRIGNDGLVKEAAQQNPISRDATAGIFWFARCGDFVSGAKNLIRKNASVGGVFYIAPVLNELILNQASIGVVQVQSDVYHPLKDERQIQQFELGG